MDLVITTIGVSILLAVMHSKLLLIAEDIPNAFTPATATKILTNISSVIIIARTLAYLARLLLKREAEKQPPKPKYFLYPHVATCFDTESPCAVCLYEGSNNAALQCGHTFHWACVRPWLDMRNTCPLCKRTQSRICLDDKGNVIVVEAGH
jgi:hypothetical protein